MPCPPLLYTPHVLGSLEVVFVLRSGVPSTLTQRFARLATLRFGAMALATAITMVRNVELPAMQTPGLGSSFHRQTRKQPPKLEENAPKPRRKSPGHTPPSHHRNKTEKKSFELKFRKKSAPRDIRSSNRPTYPISKSPFSIFERVMRIFLIAHSLALPTQPDRNVNGEKIRA